MSNSNTEHSKKLRAASAAAADKRILAAGGFRFSGRLKKEQGADLFRALSEEHGSSASAIRFLLNFYKANKEHD